MNKPFRINQPLAATIVFVADLFLGALIFFALTSYYPSLHVILPKAISTAEMPYWGEITLFATYWAALFFLSGQYRQLRRKGVGSYMIKHWGTCFVGMVFFTFFFFIKNDALYQYGFFHFFFEVYLFVTIILALPRLVFYLWVWQMMKNGKAAIHTLIIGNTEKAEAVYNDIEENSGWINYHFIGYIESSQDNTPVFAPMVPKLGRIENLPTIIENNQIDEAIVAIDSHEYKIIEEVLASIRHHNITIKLLPDLSAILEGNVKTDNIKGLPLITINNRLMPVWQMVLKWLFDTLVSLLALTICLPFFPIIAWAIKRNSPGPVFYIQPRIGKGRKSFNIIKFRSMRLDAEVNGPALSSNNDPRITPFGRFLRKWHIDEIPQFLNVLKGDMSIVGPRPERAYFVDQIMKIAPHYSHLFSVKPGITSWGMVKYGYAENVNQMVERLKYDIIYLENISLGIDLKIIMHTIKEVFAGNGK